MKKGDYSKISIEHFAKQMHVNVINEKDDFIVSKSPTNLQEHALDFSYPHIMEGISVVFCLKGKASIKINLLENEIQQYTLVVAAPNSIVQVLEQSEDFKIEFLFFTFDFISDFKLTTQLGDIIKSVEDKSCFYLLPAVFEELLSAHEFILKQYQKDAGYRQEIVKSYLSALLYQILQLYALEHKTTNTAATRKDEIHMKFMALLFLHYKNERSVQFYADKLHITPKHFAKVIKSTTGRSVTQWIDEMVVMAAKALLKSSGLTVAQIADELNFTNPSFFGSYFRTRTGLTPIQYRQM